MVAAEILAGFGHIFTAPFRDLSVLWILIPIFSIWLILEVYFETHKSEELGWNTALGNGVSLFWLMIPLLKFIFGQEGIVWSKAAFLILILLYGIFVIILAFTHKLSSKITYALAAPTWIYFLAGVATLWIYGSLEITSWVLLDLFILLGIVILVLQIIKKFAPQIGGMGKEGPEEFPEIKVPKGSEAGFPKI